ncbi:MAG: hypothetical protein MZV64_24410 [Ignavibacteriales bacterium]|nr:hypothetical protein [Ignavibacteriales bacterium]
MDQSGGHQRHCCPSGIDHPAGQYHQSVCSRHDRCQRYQHPDDHPPKPDRTPYTGRGDQR